MTHGLDTGFLVAVEVAEHPAHADSKKQLAELVLAGDRFALAPQVLAEFVHVVTDPKRFTRPLEMRDALRLAQQWWTAREVDQVFPNDSAVSQFLGWMQLYGLGRKRLLDTLLAATYRTAGANSLLTLNSADFAALGGFAFIATKPGDATS